VKNNEKSANNDKVTAKVGEVIAETNHSERNWSQAILSNLMYANNRAETNKTILELE
jgi:hypothetical protein